MGTWDFSVLSARKPPMPIKLLVLGGSIWLFFFGGGSADLSSAQGLF